MNSIKLIILFVIISVTMCSAQDKQDSLTVNKRVNYYYINDKPIITVAYELINNNSTDLWFWFEKEDATNKQDELIIKEHFFSRKDAWSLSGIALDGNVEINGIDLFFNFVKFIKPQEQFLIIAIIESTVNEFEINEVFSYFDKHIVAYSKNTLEKTIKGLDDFFSYIFYKFFYDKDYRIYKYINTWKGNECMYVKKNGF